MSDKNISFLAESSFDYLFTNKVTSPHCMLAYCTKPTLFCPHIGDISRYFNWTGATTILTANII